MATSLLRPHAFPRRAITACAIPIAALAECDSVNLERSRRVDGAALRPLPIPRGTKAHGMR